jgi:RecB family exonuclease
MSSTLPMYSPAKINLYRLCPHRYFRRYISNDLPPMPFSEAVARGDVAHKLIQHGFRRYKARGSFPDDLEVRARGYLRKYRYQNGEQFEADVRSIVEWVQYAFDSFDRRCSVVLAEQHLSYTRRNSARTPIYRLEARIDLLIEYPDGRFEQIDWKTGKWFKPDPIQSLISFVVVHERLKVAPDAIRTTVVSLPQRRPQFIEISREAARPTWDDVRAAIRDIRKDTTWPARANPFCPNCPLFENGCPLGGPHFLDMGTQPERQPIST